MRVLLKHRPQLYPALIILCCAFISVAVVYPGRLGPDSSWQLEQAISGRYSDWHPPIMAALWRLLLNFGDGPAPMLLVQVGLYWLGVWAIFDGSRDCGRWRALLVLAPALHPLLLVLLEPVLKDVGMASAFIAAFGLIYRQRQLGRPLNPVIAIAAAMFLAYGTLARTNGVFALPALLLYWAAPSWLGVRRLIPASALIVALSIPASDFINHSLLRAERSRVEVTLQLYDRVGIAHFSGEEHRVRAPDGCYNPFHWDTLNEPECGQLFDKLSRIDSARVGRLWISAILADPVAYVRHRLGHFNSSTYFLVAPAHHCRFAPDYSGCDRPRSTLNLIDFIRKNFLYWPIVWLAAGVWLVTRRNAESGSKALGWSGLMYGIGFLFVGVATDYRYYFWPILAIGMGIGLHLARTQDLLASLKGLAVTVLLVASGGYAARLVYAASGA